MLDLAITRYLMLDFDGVTHHFFPIAGEDASNGHFVFLPAIEAVVRDCPYPVRIVITSTWRNKYPLDVLQRHFAPDIAPLVIGGTPKLELSMKPGGRLDEVLEWINAHAPGAPWVALDDMDDLYASGSQTMKTVALVRCPDEFGERQAQELRQALDDPGAWAQAHPGPRY